MDKTVIEKIAKLSKLRLSEDEINTFIKEFKSIIEYMEQLKEVNVDGFESYMTPVTDHLRKDEIREGNIIDKKIALHLASHTDDNYYVVPKVGVK